MNDKRLVSVIDDDESVRESLPDLIEELGFEVRVFDSGEAFLCSDAVQRTTCVLVDVLMGGMSGYDVVAQINARGLPVAVIFITAQHDEIVPDQLSGRDEIRCLYKPFGDVELLEALTYATSCRIER